MWICDSCQKENCKNCENKWRCHCKCNKKADIVQKCLASVLGCGMAIGGVALGFASGGLAIPISGALLGYHLLF